MTAADDQVSLRIVLAEDSPLLRAGIVAVLETDGHEVCAAVSDGPQLLAASAAHVPDLVITDVRMPPTFTDEGIAAAMALRRVRPHLAIVILSQYTSVGSLHDLLDQGSGTGRAGLGYLLKDRVAHVRHFLDAVRSIASGHTVIDPEVIAAVLGESRRRGILAALTPREQEVLARIAEGMTNGQIASELGISDPAVRKHVGNIFAKLPLDDKGDRRVLAALSFLDGRT